jgi:hypothetical protein
MKVAEEIVSGGLSAFFGVIFLQPLDVIKTVSPKS